MVLKALGRLNERYQRAISLRYLAGLSPEEAARGHGGQQGDAGGRAAPGAGALRRAMDDLGHTETIWPEEASE